MHLVASYQAAHRLPSSPHLAPPSTPPTPSCTSSPAYPTLPYPANVLCSTPVRIVASHQAADTKAVRTTLLSTTGGPATGLRDTLVSVLGARVVETLTPLSFEAEGLGIRAEGFVSKAGAGVRGADAGRQFVFLNGRPVDLPKVLKV